MTENTAIIKIIDEITACRNITLEQLHMLLETDDMQAVDYLRKRASEKAHETYGNQVFIRGLIEFTNYCKNDCLIDNRKKGCKEAQFQLGYKGYIQLAERSGYYKKLNVLAIKEGELIRYDPLDEEIEVELIDDDVIREETPAMGYYAMFEYENGFRKTMYWSKKKMMAHAEKYSPAFSRNGGAKTLELLEQGKIPEKDLWKYSSFWFKDFEDRKSVV